MTVLWLVSPSSLSGIILKLLEVVEVELESSFVSLGLMELISLDMIQTIKSVLGFPGLNNSSSIHQWSVRLINGQFEEIRTLDNSKNVSLEEASILLPNCCDMKIVISETLKKLNLTV